MAGLPTISGPQKASSKNSELESAVSESFLVHCSCKTKKDTVGCKKSRVGHNPRSNGVGTPVHDGPSVAVRTGAGRMAWGPLSLRATALRARLRAARAAGGRERVRQDDIAADPGRARNADRGQRN